MTLELLAPAASNMSTADDIQFNEATLEVLFKEHFKPLCAYCQYKFGFELDVAKEAVHTGFIRLWENRDTISSDLSLKAYLYKVVTNISLDMLKHEKVKQQHLKYVSQNTSAGSLSTGFNDSERKELAADIEKAVSELPGEMRRIFELSRYEGLKYAEIAAHLNISVKTVETQMSRALVKLRKSLSHYIALFLITILFHLS
ncbi:MAG: RNA polymerase sigma-70 factor [Flavisolibacter sp.]|nr:RNA polymerase sigma-70 factor [Flavisolibacter sp.]